MFGQNDAMFAVVLVSILSNRSFKSQSALMIILSLNCLTIYWEWKNCWGYPSDYTKLIIRSLILHDYDYFFCLECASLSWPLVDLKLSNDSGDKLNH